MSAELAALRRVADEAYSAVAGQEPWSTDDLSNLSDALDALDAVLLAEHPEDWHVATISPASPAGPPAPSGLSGGGDATVPPVASPEHASKEKP
jgi:hypothetical protein